jgi:hypothetical protein
VSVEGSKDDEGASVKAEACNNGAGQKWKILYEDKAEKAKTKGLNTDFGMEINRPFFIVSKMFGERVIECIGANNLVLRTPVPRRDRKAQHFVFDEVSKTIKSVQWNTYSMTIQNQGRSNNLRVERTNSRWFQLFEYKNNKFVNEKGKVVEIAGGVDRENANIQVFKDLGASKINQLWDLIYVDEMPKEPVKGELSPKFGLIVETPFYIQSNHG